MPQIDDHGNAVYSMTPADFAGYMKVLVDNGASVIGGCCGTTPDHIRKMAEECKDLSILVPQPKDRTIGFPL